MKKVLVVLSSKNYNFCLEKADICTLIKTKFSDSFITYCLPLQLPNVNDLVPILTVYSSIDRVTGYGNCLTRVVNSDPYNGDTDILITIRNEEDYIKECELLK